MVNHSKDLQDQPNVDVVVLLVRRLVSSDIHFPRLMYCDKEDLCLVTH